MALCFHCLNLRYGAPGLGIVTINVITVVPSGKILLKGSKASNVIGKLKESNFVTSKDLGEIVMAIEQAITANGKYCRNCIHCSNRTVIEPICQKSILIQRHGLGVLGFCSNARTAGGTCGPDGRLYELLVAETTRPDAPKDKHNDIS